MSTPGRLTRDDLEALVRSGEVDTILVALPDLQGRLQGKRFDATFFLNDPHAVAEGCAYLLATDVDMRTVDGFPLTSWDQGYGDVGLRPDWSTVRRIPWHHATAIVIADAASEGGDLVSVAPRSILRRQAERLAERGWRGLVGTELEFLVFAETYDQAWRAGYRDLSTSRPFNVDYSLQGTAPDESLIGQIRRSMRGAGMVVESAKGECHPGQHEIAFQYGELVDKCDEHTLYKLGAKEIAAQLGRSLTFMAKFDEREGNSCHVHLSLRDADDRPVFASGDGHSAVFDQFLAGLVAHTRELALMLAPTVNSYKRFVAGSFAPTALVWGRDNRTCAFRVVGHGPSLRVECRIPGGDANPYLACAALVAAGLRGVEEQRPLPAPFTGNAYVADAPRVPATLREAVALLRGSEVARDAFGPDVVSHLVRCGEVELEAFDSVVTDWERFRGFERL